MNNRQNIARAKAIELKNKERLLKVNPNLNDKRNRKTYNNRRRQNDMGFVKAST